MFFSMIEVNNTNSRSIDEILKKDYYMVGEILEDDTRVKGIGNGGYKYFLDSRAFYEKDGICYIDEEDNEYTYEYFIELTNGNETLAESYFDSVSGTCPGLLLEEDLDSGEAFKCEECDKFYTNSDIDDIDETDNIEGYVPKCPYCNHKEQ